jgi:hypothetical protein
MNKLKFGYFYKLFTTILLGTFFVFNFSSAANVPWVLIKTNKTSLPINDILVVDVVVNSQGEIINSIEGSFVYDKDVLTLENVQTGDSLVSLWVEKPNMDTAGFVNFAGVIPGGVVLTDSNIFSLIFRANKNTQTELDIKNFNLLINDGSGTSINSNVIGALISVSGDSLKELPKIQNSDNFLPSKFKINRTKDKSIFDNQWFIVFLAQDKESGISHYEVCEGFKNTCIKSNSPHLLKNQSAFYYVKVIAFDQNGNSQKSILISNYYYLVFVILLGLFIFFVLKFLNKKK